MLLLPAIFYLLDDREPAGVRGVCLLEDPALNPVPFAWVNQSPTQQRRPGRVARVLHQDLGGLRLGFWF
jgi:hypothetical protein